LVLRDAVKKINNAIYKGTEEGGGPPFSPPTQGELVSTPTSWTRYISDDGFITKKAEVIRNKFFPGFGNSLDNHDQP
jgi:hypothetical protein